MIRAGSAFVVTLAVGACASPNTQPNTTQYTQPPSITATPSSLAIVSDGQSALGQNLFRTQITRPTGMGVFAFNDLYNAHLRQQCPRGFEVTELGREHNTLDVQFRCVG